MSPFPVHESRRPDLVPLARVLAPMGSPPHDARHPPRKPQRSAEGPDPWAPPPAPEVSSFLFTYLPREPPNDFRPAPIAGLDLTGPFPLHRPTSPVFGRPSSAPVLPTLPTAPPAHSEPVKPAHPSERWSSHALPSTSVTDTLALAASNLQHLQQPSRDSSSSSLATDVPVQPALLGAAPRKGGFSTPPTASPVRSEDGQSQDGSEATVVNTPTPVPAALADAAPRAPDGERHGTVLDFGGPAHPAPPTVEAGSVIFLPSTPAEERTRTTPVRPALRTPTPSGRSPSPKAVRFSPSLTHTRHFFHTDAPVDVSNPFNTRYSLRATIPISWGSVVRLEGLRLPDSKFPHIEGSVVVKNLAFEKMVTIRYTLDGWASYGEVSAKYVGAWVGVGGGDEVFGFELDLDGSWKQDRDSMDMQVVVKYEVGGAEYWDNNCGRNYEVTAMRRVVEDISETPPEHADAPPAAAGDDAAEPQASGKAKGADEYPRDMRARPAKRRGKALPGELTFRDDESDESDTDDDNDDTDEDDDAGGPPQSCPAPPLPRRGSLHPHAKIGAGARLHHPRPVSPTHPVPGLETVVNGAEYLSSFGLVAPASLPGASTSPPSTPMSGSPSQRAQVDQSPFFGTWPVDGSGMTPLLDPAPYAPLAKQPRKPAPSAAQTQRVVPPAPGAAQFTTSSGYPLSLSWAPDMTYMYSAIRSGPSTPPGDPPPLPPPPGQLRSVSPGGSQRYGSPFASGLYASDDTYGSLYLRA